MSTLQFILACMLLVSCEVEARDRNVPAAAQTVVDGDTIKLNGSTIRLHGIDAPEIGQACGGWPAGIHAASALRTLLEGRRVSCTPTTTTDRYRRTVAVCHADGVDIGAAMVRQGAAWAFTRYSVDYMPQEQQARAEGLGIHARACQPAWEYRRARR